MEEGNENIISEKELRDLEKYCMCGNCETERFYGEWFLWVPRIFTFFLYYEFDGGCACCIGCLKFASVDSDDPTSMSPRGYMIERSRKFRDESK